MSAALVLDGKIEAMVPEDRVIAMIENCADQIERATTIPMVLRMVRQADAIAAVTRKIEASKRVQRDAETLVIYAETQLGVITRQIPQGRRGPAAVPGQATKGAVLAQHGLHRSRANIAEKLAATPPKVLEAAIEKAERKTVHGVAVELGFAQPWLPGRVATTGTILAAKALELLRACVDSNSVPDAREVERLEQRYATLKQQSSATPS